MVRSTTKSSNPVVNQSPMPRNRDHIFDIRSLRLWLVRPSPRGHLPLHPPSSVDGAARYGSCLTHRGTNIPIAGDVLPVGHTGPSGAVAVMHPPSVEPVSPRGEPRLRKNRLPRPAGSATRANDAAQEAGPRPAARPPSRAMPRPSSLRVALVTEYFYPHMGGICEHVHHLASELRARGHHADIITSHLQGGEERPDVIRIGDSITVRSNGSLARVTVGKGLRRAMRAALERGRYDVVHVHAPLTPSLPMLAVDEARCALVGTFHAYFDYSVAYIFGRRYFQRLMDRLDAAIAVSPAARDSAARYFETEWSIVPNGVDTDLFHPGAAPPPVLGDGVPTVLYVGRFDPRNGLPSLIEAFRLLRAEGREARLVVVGDGPERDRYRALAGGDANVHFAGRVPDGLPGYYAGCTVYACPTVLGSFGITLLEAMACGAPIACYDTPGFRNVVREGREGLMTPPGDTAAFTRSLARLLDDAALRERMGRAGRERALEYAWPRVTDEVLEIYARAMDRAPAPLDARRRLEPARIQRQAGGVEVGSVAPGNARTGKA